MTIEEIRQRIEKETGIPASLLIGETAEETISQAKALLAYKREAEDPEPQSTRDQFSNWMQLQLGIEAEDPGGQALASITEEVLASPYYPELHDGGEVDTSGLDSRSTREKFADYISPKIAFNPKENTNGWKPLG